MTDTEKFLYAERDYYKKTALRLRAELEDRDLGNIALHKQYEKLQEMYDNVINSFCWRATGPVRHLSDMLRGNNAAEETAAEEAAAEETVAETACETAPEEAALDGAPLISILIPSRDHWRDLYLCLESLFAVTDYKNYEVLILENGSAEPETFAYYDRLTREHENVRILTWDSGFNYSAINNFGARQARGDCLLLLNNDTEFFYPQWLTEMLVGLQEDSAGAVGAVLLHEDGTVQHLGMSVTREIPNLHVLRDKTPRTVRETLPEERFSEFDAVTGACLLLRREVWEQLGGLDESFTVTYNDVDLCLRLRALGYRCLCARRALLYHYDCRTRGLDSSEENSARARAEEGRFLARHFPDKNTGEE